jgi:hypothetical protein
VLTVQLKRFSFHGFHGGKIGRHIAFPETFDLAPYMSDYHPAASSDGKQQSKGANIAPATKQVLYCARMTVASAISTAATRT